MLFYILSLAYCFLDVLELFREVVMLFPQSFVLICLNLTLNFNRNVSQVYWIGMVMLVDVLYDKLRRCFPNLAQA